MTDIRFPDRRTCRLPGYDYRRPGIYFITICCHGRRPLLGHVTGESVEPSPVGEIVRQEWEKTALRREQVGLHEYVIMPDHLHGLIQLTDVGDSPLGHALRAFKAASTRAVNLLRATPGAALWQRGFWEHIVRDEEDLLRIRSYIRDNPARWIARRSRGARR